MKPIDKKVPTWLPHCSICGERLWGNNSISSPYKCSCGTWRAVIWPKFTGEYQLIKEVHE